MTKIKASKACPNKECKYHLNKKLYKEDSIFCSECGTKLVYVCKKCYKPLDDDKEVYCLSCKRGNKDLRNKMVAGLTGAAVFTVLPVPKVIKKSKNILR